MSPMPPELGGGAVMTRKPDQPASSGERLAAAAKEISRNDRHGLYDVCVTNGSGRTIAHFRGRCSRLRKGASIAG